MRCAQVYARCRKTDWMQFFKHAIKVTWPHADHMLINNGLPGASGRTYGMGTCLELNLHAQADLVIMEHHIAQDEVTQVMEHLLWCLADFFGGCVW